MLVENDGFLFLFTHDHSATARAAHRRDENVIANDVELFLVIARGIRGAGQTGEVGKTCTSDPVGNRFEGELEGVEEKAESGNQRENGEKLQGYGRHGTDVKSPVASLCLACSSVRNLVRVMMSVLICSAGAGASELPLMPLVAMAASLEAYRDSAEGQKEKEIVNEEEQTV